MAHPGGAPGYSENNSGEGLVKGAVPADQQIVQARFGGLDGDLRRGEAGVHERARVGLAGARRARCVAEGAAVLAGVGERDLGEHRELDAPALEVGEAHQRAGREFPAHQRAHGVEQLLGVIEQPLGARSQAGRQRRERLAGPPAFAVVERLEDRRRALVDAQRLLGADEQQTVGAANEHRGPRAAHEAVDALKAGGVHHQKLPAQEETQAEWHAEWQAQASWQAE